MRSSSLHPAVREGRRLRRRRAAAKGAGALLVAAAIFLVLVALGVPLDAAVGLIVLAAIIVFYGWIIVDGFRVARREGRSFAGAVGHGLWELQDFCFPSGRANTKFGRRVQGRRRVVGSDDPPDE